MNDPRHLTSNQTRQNPAPAKYLTAPVIPSTTASPHLSKSRSSSERHCPVLRNSRSCLRHTLIIKILFFILATYWQYVLVDGGEGEASTLGLGREDFGIGGGRGSLHFGLAFFTFDALGGGYEIEYIPELNELFACH